MEIRLSGKAAAKLTPRECFSRGQTVTEIGAALAYVDYFARRMASSPTANVKDISAGVHTATTTVGRLKGSLRGKSRKKAEDLERSLKSFNDSVRQKWIVGRDSMTVKDVVSIQQKTSAFRRAATEIWDDLRLLCALPSQETKGKNGRKAK